MKILALSASIAVAAFSTQASAVVGYADVVLDYHDSGAGPIPGPYGGTFNATTLAGNFPVSVSTSVVLGPDGPTADFLSLPTGSYVTVGFTEEAVYDAPGNDIFIDEIGASGETADIFVSSDNINFTLLGVAHDDGTTAFDLASIGYTGRVSSVKILGLDAFGGSPGFDVGNVQALAFLPPAVPEPASWAMMIGGIGFAGSAMRRRRAAGKTTIRFA